MASSVSPLSPPFFSLLLILLSPSLAAASNFKNDVDIIWGDTRGKIVNNGQLLTLSLDKSSSSSFHSKSMYLFGRIDMQIKLVSGNSAALSQLTIFYLDDTPIRQFKNLTATKGVPYLNNQAMRLYSSLWDAEDKETIGGIVNTDWTQAPFMATFRNLNADDCIQGPLDSSSYGSKAWMNQALDAESLKKMKWVQSNYMVYNSCSDVKKFPQRILPECSAK